MRLSLVLLFLWPIVAISQPFEGDYLYRVTSVRATPGEFSNLISAWTATIADWPEDAGERPFWMRHSQGDQWDLLFFFPMESTSAYYSADVTAKREAVGDPANSLAQDPRVARAEDLFSLGSAVEVLRAAVEGAGFYHIEMFTALPGHREELLEQRRMENRYLEGISRPRNFILRRSSGIAVDTFTLGVYRGIQHFAESADLSFDVEDRSAKAAGFTGVSGISPYLRSLIAEHHDTLAVAIR
jgi:hypothetical protein